MNFKNIRKYLRIRPHNCYSFFGEDLLINKIFKDKKNGFYIDIGCNHPKNGSITYLLYKKGWTGINIDINKENIEQMQFFRKKDLSLNLGISNSNKEMKFYKFSGGSTLNTLNKNYADTIKRKINLNYSEESIRMCTLDKIIEKHQIKQIDFLNIDVEKHENEVFEGFNLKKIRPKLITVELLKRDLNELTETKIFRNLYKNDYVCIANYLATSFFVSKDFVTESEFLNFAND